MQEVVDELKKKFPEVNKAGGFFSTAEYTLYRQGPGLDSLVNKQMAPKCKRSTVSGSSKPPLPQLHDRTPVIRSRKN